MEEALTIKEVCERFKVCAVTVRSKIKSGKLPAKRIGDGPKGQWRLSLEDCRKVFLP